MKKTYLILLCNFLISNLYGQWIFIDTINFENSNHLDTSKFVMDTSSCWQIGKPSKPVFNNAISLPNAIVTDTINSYAINCNNGFIIKGGGCFELDAKINFDTDTCYDGLVIEAFYPGDSIWVNILAFPNYMYNPSEWFNHSLISYHSTCILSSGEVGISGTGFYNFSCNFSVNSMKRMYDKRYIRFRFISDSIANTKDGIMIDDIVLTYYDCPTGINELTVEPLTVFPNPAKDIIYFAKKPENGVVIIYDATGKMILNTKIHESNLNISYLEKGIYFIEITSYDSHNFTKFIKE